MQQTVLTVETPKQVLNAYGKTYRDVARTLDLSETSVKRLFSEESENNFAMSTNYFLTIKKYNVF